MVAEGRPARKTPAPKTPARKAPARTTTAPDPPARPTPQPAVSSDPPGLPARKPPSAARSGWALVTGPGSLFPTYGGVIGVVAGFALLFYCWSRVAAQADVWRQMPYLISAGLPALGLIMVGLVVINISAKRQDGARRAQQMAALTEALTELRSRLDRS